jgi:hypothetical protein
MPEELEMIQVERGSASVLEHIDEHVGIDKHGG